MDTSCRDCVFAEWDGIKQSGCRFDRIEKFEEQGATVTLVDDHKKLYARIVGRVCNTCRHPTTLEHIPARKWMEEVRKEVIPRVAMAVYVDDDIQEINACRSLARIVEQTIRPYEVILVYNVDGKDAPPEYMLTLKLICKDIPWRIQTIKGLLVPMKEELEKADYGTSIDLAVQSNEMKAIYFTSCRAGYEFPPDYIEVIDKAINEELTRFIALRPDEEGNGLFVQRNLHNVLQGNKKMNGCNNIIEKIQEIAEEEGTSHMIKRFDELKQLVS